MPPHALPGFGDPFSGLLIRSNRSSESRQYFRNDDSTERECGRDDPAMSFLSESGNGFR